MGRGRETVLKNIAALPNRIYIRTALPNIWADQVENGRQSEVQKDKLRLGLRILEDVYGVTPTEDRRPLNYARWQYGEFHEKKVG